MWHKMRRLAVPVGISLSIVAFVAVLLIQSWEEGDEVTGTGIEYRVCNTIVRALPAQLDVSPLLGYPSRPPAMRIGFKPPIDSGSITINAVTGQIISDKVEAEERPLFDPVIATKRVEQATPIFWPYSDQVQEKPVYVDEGDFRFRYPDRGAGIEVGTIYGFNVYAQLIARNCRSSLTLQGKEGDGVDADYSGVQPEDRAAFETFAAEVHFVETE